jgi:uncharacterized protein (DUF2249 family)
VSARRKIIGLDVREDIRAGREPFSRIMAAAAVLKANEDLLVLAPFEPKPLLGVLGAQGFVHESKELPDGDWEVRFSRAGQGRGTARPAPAAPPCRAKVVELDARGLVPPEPMIKILEALGSLATGKELRARTDRRPLHLYAQVEARGFTVKSTEQPDGSFITVIRHA